MSRSHCLPLRVGADSLGVKLVHNTLDSVQSEERLVVQITPMNTIANNPQCIDAGPVASQNVCFQCIAHHADASLSLVVIIVVLGHILCSQTIIVYGSKGLATSLHK